MPAVGCFFLTLRFCAKQFVRSPSPKYTFQSEAIAGALIDGDADAVREILLSHLEQAHKDHFYKDAGISRRALFKLMEPNANPTLENLAKVCKTLAEAA
jgi:hypothetical protein